MELRIFFPREGFMLEKDSLNAPTEEIIKYLTGRICGKFLCKPNKEDIGEMVSDLNIIKDIPYFTKGVAKRDIHVITKEVARIEPKRYVVCDWRKEGIFYRKIGVARYDIECVRKNLRVRLH